MGFWVMLAAFLLGIALVIGGFIAKQSQGIKIIMIVAGLISLGFAVWLAM